MKGERLASAAAMVRASSRQPKHEPSRMSLPDGEGEGEGEGEGKR